MSCNRRLVPRKLIENVCNTLNLSKEKGKILYTYGFRFNSEDCIDCSNSKHICYRRRILKSSGQAILWYSVSLHSFNCLVFIAEMACLLRGTA